MKAAIAHQIRPSALVLGKDSRKPWGRWDLLLAKAYQRFVDEICQQCGLPKYVCHSDDNRIQFKLVRDECAASAASEAEQERMAKSKSSSHGVRVASEPYLTKDAEESGIELSDFRKLYFFDRAKQMGLIPEGTKGPVIG